MVTFRPPKSENKTKKCLTQSHTIAFNKGANFAKKQWFFAKNAGINKIKRALVLKDIFSENTYLCGLKY